MGFGTVIILSVILSATAIWSMWSMDKNFTHLFEHAQKRYDALLRASNEAMAAKQALSSMSMFAGLDGADTGIKDQLETIGKNSIILTRRSIFI